MAEIKTGLAINEERSHDRFRYFNPNPRYVKSEDCAIRALSAFLWIDWDESYKLLTDAGFKVKNVPNSKRTMEYVLKEQKAIDIKILPYDGHKPSVKEFAESHSEGIYLLSVAGHYVTIREGYYYDTWDCGNKKVYKAYKL